MENMNGKEIVNLIFDLRKKGISDEEILNTIIFIEMNDPKNNQFTETETNTN